MTPPVVKIEEIHKIYDSGEVPVHVDGPYAVPATSAAYERWLDQCVAWGIETFEHDWLVQVFFGVRPLRAVPGRARAWQDCQR